jgi:1,4-dihydroxy-2-naphthoate octaprenyltransferase
VALIVLVVAGLVPPSTLIAFITLPEARMLIRMIHTQTDTASLHQAQGRTARLHGRFGYLMAAGWLVWLLIDALV